MDKQKKCRYEFRCHLHCLFVAHRYLSGKSESLSIPESTSGAPTFVVSSVERYGETTAGTPTGPSFEKGQRRMHRRQAQDFRHGENDVPTRHSRGSMAGVFLLTSVFLRFSRLCSDVGFFDDVLRKKLSRRNLASNNCP